MHLRVREIQLGSVVCVKTQPLSYNVQCTVNYVLAMCDVQCSMFKVQSYNVQCGSVVGLVISVPGSFLLSQLIDERAERTA